MMRRTRMALSVGMLVMAFGWPQRDAHPTPPTRAAIDRSTYLGGNDLDWAYNIAVDDTGNVYVSGPGGLWILSPEGRHLGTIMGPEHPHNMAWGDDDGRALYLTAQTGLYRLRLNIAGVRP